MKDRGRQRFSTGLFALVVLFYAAGCAGAETIGGVALTVLKIVAGLAVAVLVFFPLMASIAAIRAALRRRRRPRERRPPTP